MGRANNTSRSLQIISRQQGWDPSKIQGTPNPGTPQEDFDLESMGYTARESPLDYSTTQRSFPGNNDTSGNQVTVKPSGADTRGGVTRDKGPKGDPYPGKPGSKPTRGGR